MKVSDLRKITKILFFGVQTFVYGLTMFLGMIWAMGVGLASTIVLTGVQPTSSTVLIGNTILMLSVVVPLYIVILVGMSVLEDSKLFVRLGVVKE